MADLTVKKGNYGFDLEFSVKNTDGSAKNLTSFTVTLKVWRSGEASCEFTGACTITDAEAGECKYTVASGDFDAVGTYNGELELTKAGVVQDTKTFSIDIVETAP